MVWIVDGRRRSRGKKQVVDCIKAASIVNLRPPIVALSLDTGPLLRDWQNSSAPVYFDFDDSHPDTSFLSGRTALWRLDLSRMNDKVFRTLIDTQSSLHACLMGQQFEHELTDFVAKASTRYTLRRSSPPRPLCSFERYNARQRKRRLGS